nr:MAG TPA: hypothetical protein [Caudoviricetes sp.]
MFFNQFKTRTYVRLDNSARLNHRRADKYLKYISL